jgi:transcriptional regulator with XRE-family HTH domain
LCMATKAELCMATKAELCMATNAGLSHNGFMARQQNPNRIAELRLRRRWSQPELAERVGAHWVTISKLERGQMQLTHDWMDRLAHALGVEPAELISDSPIVRTLYISGLISEHCRVHDQVIGDEVSEEDKAIAYDMQLGVSEPERTVWYFIETGALYPYFQIGDVIRFTYQIEHDPDSVVGRLCLIELDAPAQEKIVGVLARGRTPGTFDIQVPGNPPIESARIKEAAPASMALFAPQFLPDEDGVPGIIADTAS